MEYEWDSAKADANARKHGVSFADAALSLEDPMALTIADPDCSGEACFVTLAVDPLGRVLVTVHTPRQERIRIVSSRPASPGERRTYENQ